MNNRYEMKGWILNFVFSLNFPFACGDRVCFGERESRNVKPHSTPSARGKLRYGSIRASGSEVWPLKVQNKFASTMWPLFCICLTGLLMGSRVHGLDTHRK